MREHPLSRLAGRLQLEEPGSLGAGAGAAVGAGAGVVGAGAGAGAGAGVVGGPGTGAGIGAGTMITGIGAGAGVAGAVGNSSWMVVQEPNNNDRITAERYFMGIASK